MPFRQNIDRGLKSSIAESRSTKNLLTQNSRMNILLNNNIKFTDSKLMPGSTQSILLQDDNPYANNNLQAIEGSQTSKNSSLLQLQPSNNQYLQLQPNSSYGNLPGLGSQSMIQTPLSPQFYQQSMPSISLINQSPISHNFFTH